MAVTPPRHFELGLEEDEIGLFWLPDVHDRLHALHLLPVQVVFLCAAQRTFLRNFSSVILLAEIRFHIFNFITNNTKTITNFTKGKDKLQIRNKLYDYSIILLWRVE